MIIKIPECKKINYNKHLNESLFDDDDIFNSTTDIFTDIGQDSVKEYEESELKPKLEKLLYQLDVNNYEIICKGNGIMDVNVHDHLYLVNRKLNNIKFSNFRFNTVDGNCNFSGNNLTDWSKFPKIIKGNLYANFNLLKNFEDAPVIFGDIIASKQNKKSDYPLTKDNYIKIKHNITENSVYAIPVNKFGEIYNINENDNSCIIEFEDKSRQKFKLSDVEYLGKLENLLI